jgi:ribosomal protein S27E
MFNKCPGSEKRFIKSSEIECPYCGENLEIFSDEAQVWCPKCKKFICRSKNKIPECFDWCLYADRCRLT